MKHDSHAETMKILDERERVLREQELRVIRLEREAGLFRARHNEEREQEGR